MPGNRVENKLEIRAYIKGRSLLGLQAKDIHREVCDIYGEGQMSRSTVFRWVAKFKSGEQQLEDAARSGRPKTSVTKKNIGKISNLINADARYTVRQLARMTSLSLAIVHEILKKHLKVRKINARWIPHLLTDAQKNTRVTMAKNTAKKPFLMSSLVMRRGFIITSLKGKFPTEFGPRKMLDVQVSPNERALLRRFCTPFFSQPMALLYKRQSQRAEL